MERTGLDETGAWAGLGWAGEIGVVFVRLYTWCGAVRCGAGCCRSCAARIGLPAACCILKAGRLPQAATSVSRAALPLVCGACCCCMSQQQVLLLLLQMLRCPGLLMRK
ncbi:hypothetical protein PLESTB_000738500 [Pleodorina starrii]|uniref:Uncharacterized protein n=1 Tax=Pleodorina starrii TaxID=330485 RepID=A0A9W6BKE5_9CHLO|nr:hypothetical protein PLESTB_000738500 [Pleodorina starrii]GLC67150.1 hypothetical protein PLESTF_000522600 [Pleodorina starrii]